MSSNDQPDGDRPETDAPTPVTDAPSARRRAYTTDDEAWGKEAAAARNDASDEDEWHAAASTASLPVAMDTDADAAPVKAEAAREDDTRTDPPDDAGAEGEVPPGSAGRSGEAVVLVSGRAPRDTVVDPAPDQGRAATQDDAGATPDPSATAADAKADDEPKPSDEPNAGDESKPSDESNAGDESKPSDDAPKADGERRQPAATAGEANRPVPPAPAADAGPDSPTRSETPQAPPPTDTAASEASDRDDRDAPIPPRPSEHRPSEHQGADNGPATDDDTDDEAGPSRASADDGDDGESATVSADAHAPDPPDASLPVEAALDDGDADGDADKASTKRAGETLVIDKAVERTAKARERHQSAKSGTKSSTDKDLRAAAGLPKKPAPRGKRRRLGWRGTLILIGLVLVAAGVIALVILGRQNSRNYYLRCDLEAGVAVPEQGRSFPPWGQSTIDGVAWAPVRIPPGDVCRPAHYQRRQALANAVWGGLLDQVDDWVIERSEGPNDGLAQAEAQLDQAAQLVPELMPAGAGDDERQAKRRIDQLRGDLAYWRARDEVDDAHARLTQAIEHLMDARTHEPHHHPEDVAAWLPFAQRIAAALARGPGAEPPAAAQPPPTDPAGEPASTPTPEPTPPEPTPAAPQPPALAPDAGVAPAEPAPTAPSDAGLRRGGNLI
ncbi:hypothetical protein [Haliangium sp.]|uniref:hypothetical protein n=1 Tax=Haliangium sp. TaxID=2663208 RepID=UPI003D0D3ABB